MSCLIPVDEVNRFDLYFYCNPSRTITFIYSLTKDPTINGFVVNTVLYQPIPNGPEYHKVLSVSRAYPEDNIPYSTFLRFVSSACDPWNISVSPSILICSLQPRPENYETYGSNCDPLTWLHMGLYRFKAYGPVEIGVKVYGLLSTSHGHKITLETGFAGALGSTIIDTTITFEYSPSFAPPPLLKTIDNFTTTIQGTAIVTVEDSGSGTQRFAYHDSNGCPCQCNNDTSSTEVGHMASSYGYTSGPFDPPNADQGVTYHCTATITYGSSISC